MTVTSGIDRTSPSQAKIALFRSLFRGGGFGNLVALPLHKGPRKQDNSVFLDDDFVPFTSACLAVASTLLARR